ncbi:MAG: SpaA isopeptide-forming pilin-related protein [Lachnospiraceae bacterium]|nr:SpaA isopeptide-forming pilin-related protein [Lachnospiraceae bacterium]
MYKWTVTIQAPTETDGGDLLTSITINDTTTTTYQNPPRTVVYHSPVPVGDTGEEYYAIVTGTIAGTDIVTETKYDDVTLKYDSATPNPNITGFILELADNYDGGVTITYFTALTQAGMEKEGGITLPNNVVVTFNNNQSLTANSHITIPENQFQLVGKDGRFIPERQVIEWTVTVNTRGQRYEYLRLKDMIAKPYAHDQLSVKVSDKNGNVLTPGPVGDPIANPITYDSVSDVDHNIMTVKIFEDGKPLYGNNTILVITYETPTAGHPGMPDYSNPGANDIKVNNIATLEWKWIWGTGPGPGIELIPPSVDKSPNISPMPVRKRALSYDPGTRTITWLITVNENRVSMTDIILTDILGAGQINLEYVPDSFSNTYSGTGVITEGIDGGGNFTLTIADSFSNPITTTETLRVTTIVDDRDFLKGNCTETFSNKIEIDALINGVKRESSDNAHIVLKNDVLRKTPGEFDYSNHTQEWTIVINADKILDFKDVTLTDTIPYGQSLVKWGSLEIVNPDDVEADAAEIFRGFPAAGITVTAAQEPGPNEPTVVKFDVGDFLSGETLTLRYRTHKVLPNNVTNMILMNTVGQESYLGETTEFDVDKEIPVKPLQKKVISVERPNNTTAVVTYHILINQSNTPFAHGNVNIDDKITTDGTPPGLRIDIDPSSFRLFSATIDTQGAFDYDIESPTFLNDTALNLNMFNDTDFRVTIPQHTKACVLEYAVVVRSTEPLTGFLNNDINFDNFKIDDEDDFNDTASANLNNNSGSGGMVNRMVALEITKHDDKEKPDVPDEQLLLPGAKFGLFYSKGSAPLPGADPISTAISGQDGKLSFQLLLPRDVNEENYYIKELEAPVGYVLNNDYIKLENPPFAGTGNLRTITLNNDRTAHQISFTKVDAKGDILVGAEFTLYDDQNGDLIIDTVTSDSSGIVTFNDLKWGVYTLEETDYPDGFVPYAGRYTLTVYRPVKDSDGNILDPVVTISKKTEGSIDPIADYPKTAPFLDTSVTPNVLKVVNERPTIKLTMIDEKSKDAIIADAGIGLEEGQYILKKENSFGVWVPVGGDINNIHYTEDGVLLFDGDLLEFGGKYRIYEKKPPTGYNAKGTDPVVDHIFLMDFDFSSPKRNEVHIDEKIEYERKGMYDFYFFKHIQNYEDGVKVTGAGATDPTSGAFFELRDSADNVIESVVSSDVVGMVGKVHFGVTNQLPFDDEYFVYEITAPDGYALPIDPDEPIFRVELVRDTYGDSGYMIYDLRKNPEELIFDTTEGDDPADFPFVNEKGTITITKKDNLYPDVKSGFDGFKINVTSSPADPYLDDVDFIAADGKGEITVKGLTLGITYTFTEITAPAGYTTIGADPVIFEPELGGIKGSKESGEVVDGDFYLGNDRNPIHEFEFTKIGPLGSTGLAGAEFKLEFTNEPDGSQLLGAPWAGATQPQTQTQTSDVDGIVKFTSLPFGSYKINETKAPDGYILNTTQITFTIASDGELTAATPAGGLQGNTIDGYTFANSLGSYSLTKRDAVNNQLLGDIEFILQREDSTGTFVEFDRKTTNSSTGIINFINLFTGKYRLIETVPVGYSGHEITDFEVEEFEIADEAGKRNLIDTIYNNRDPIYSFGFLKTDNHNNLLEHAEFGLYTEASCAADKAILGFNTTTGAPLVAPSGGTHLTASSNASGQVIFNNLPFGTYYLREMAATDIIELGTEKYRPSKAVLQVVIAPDGKYTITAQSDPQNDISGTAVNVNSGTVSSLSLKNTLLGSITINIIDGEIPSRTVITNNDNSANFEIYKAADIDDGKPISGSTPVAAVKTTVNGIVKFEGLEIGEDYVVINTGVAATSIFAQTDEIHEFKLVYDSGDETKYHQTADFLFFGDRIAEFTKKDPFDTVLSGAEFGLYYDAACTNPVGGAAAHIKVTSDTNGKVAFSKLKVGTYYAKEITAPAGYIANTTVFKIVTHKTEATIITDNVDVTNTPITEVVNARSQGYSFGFKKEDNHNNLLGGALFGLYSDAACDTADEIHSFDAYGRPVNSGGTHITVTSTSVAPVGDVSFGSLPYGTYYVKEKATANPIKLADDIYRLSNAILKVVVAPDGKYTITAQSDPQNDISGTAVNVNSGTVSFLSLKNTLLGSITINIVNGEVFPQTMITEAGNQGTFGIFLPADIENGSLKAGAVPIKTAQKTVSGTLTFEGIELGVDYVVVNIAKEATSIYAISEDIKDFKLTYSAVRATYHQTVVFPFYYKGDKTFNFLKVDYSGPLAGAQFTLYYNNIPPLLLVGGNFNPNNRVTSNAAGEVVFEELRPGTYYMRETIIPDGYEHPPASVWRVEITPTGTFTIVDNLDASNTPIDEILNPRSQTYSFGFIKQDNFGNELGGAVFGLYSGAACGVADEVHSFESSGKPINGGSGHIIATSDDITGEVIFTDLPFGTYYVVEIEEPATPATSHDSYKISDVVLKVIIEPDGTYSIEIEEGTMYDDSGATTDINSGDVSELIVINELLGYIIIEVFDNVGPLEGITITMTGASNFLDFSLSGFSLPPAATTNTSGMVMFTGLPIGPPGAPFQFTFAQQDLTDRGYVFEDPISISLVFDPMASDQLSLGEFNNAGDITSYGASLEFEKRNAAGNPLGNAIFGIVRETDPSSPNVPDLDAFELGTSVTSILSGLVELPVLGDGTYYIREIQAPGGYILSDTVLKVEIDNIAGTASIEWLEGLAVSNNGGKLVVVNHLIVIPGNNPGGGNNSNNQWVFDEESGEWVLADLGPIPQTGVRDLSVLIYLLAGCGLAMILTATAFKRRDKKKNE